jgi:glycerol-3-phosphate acyltransferase PlsY
MRKPLSLLNPDPGFKDSKIKTMLKYFLTFSFAYLLGSLVTAVWAGKIFHKVDVREHGSGNAGATNVIRVLGWGTGIPVLLADILKGWLAAMLPVFFKLADPGSAYLINLQIICGIFAVLGHIFPIFAGFRGGKGVATVFGVLMAIHPYLTLSCAGVFLIVLMLSGYVSVSSICAGIAFPLLLLFIYDTPSVLFRIFSVVVMIGIIITHRKNISRLLRGEENKLFRKKSR